MPRIHVPLTNAKRTDVGLKKAFIGGKTTALQQRRKTDELQTIIQQINYEDYDNKVSCNETRGIQLYAKWWYNNFCWDTQTMILLSKISIIIK